MLKTFVCFHLPGDSLTEKEVETRSIKVDDIPPGTVAYEFYDAQVVEAEDGELCYGEPRNRSPLIWICCSVLSKDELKEIIKDMEEADIEKVIFTPDGECFFYDEEENYMFTSYDELKIQ